MDKLPDSRPEITQADLDAIACGNAAIQVLGEFGAAEKIGSYWVARLEVEAFAFASVIGPPNDSGMPSTVNVKVVSGDVIVLDVEWGENYCRVMTFAEGEWRDRLRALGASMKRGAADSAPT